MSFPNKKQLSPIVIREIAARLQMDEALLNRHITLRKDLKLSEQTIKTLIQAILAKYDKNVGPALLSSLVRQIRNIDDLTNLIYALSKDRKVRTDRRTTRSVRERTKRSSRSSRSSRGAEKGPPVKRGIDLRLPKKSVDRHEEVSSGPDLPDKRDSPGKDRSREKAANGGDKIPVKTDKTEKEKTSDKSSKEERRVHVVIYYEKRRRFNFVKGKTHKVRCKISELDLSIDEPWAPATDKVQDVDIGPEGVGLDVQLIYKDQAHKSHIHLPPAPLASSECEFTLTLDTEDSMPILEIAFLYMGRIFEMVDVVAFAVDDPAIDPGKDGLKVISRIHRREVINLKKRRHIEMSITMDEAGIIIFGNEPGHIRPLQDLHEGIKWLNDELFQAEKDLIRQRPVSQPDEEPILEAGDPIVLSFLRTLARHGNQLYRHMKRKGHGINHIEVFNKASDYVQPVEFVYDRGNPSDKATLCPGWQEALSGDMDKCPTCKRAEDLTDEERIDTPTICPLGFWSLRMIIERHQLKKEDAHDATMLVPVDGRDHLPKPKSILYGMSNNVDEPDQLATESVFKSIFKESAYEAADWDKWADHVKANAPSLLIALPHQGIGPDRIGFLEIGGKVLSSGNLNSVFVTRQENAPGPIVVMLGCKTQEQSEFGYASMASRFQEANASIVVGTLSQVVGRHAAPVAQELVRQLTEYKSGTFRFGELLRRIRRRMLLHGYLMAFSIIALGDADWVISYNKN